MSAYDGFLAYQNFYENHKPHDVVIHQVGQFYNEQSAKVLQHQNKNESVPSYEVDGLIKNMQLHYTGEFPPPELLKMKPRRRMRGGEMPVTTAQVEAEVAKKIESAGKQALAKLGLKSGKGMKGGSIFGTIKSALKKSPKAFLKVLDVQPTDTVLEAFVKGLKSPITLGEKFEKLTGMSIPDTAEKLGPLLASAAALQPELAPVLLPASAAILAGGEAFRVAKEVDTKVLKPAGL